MIHPIVKYTIARLYLSELDTPLHRLLQVPAFVSHKPILQLSFSAFLVHNQQLAKGKLWKIAEFTDTGEYKNMASLWHTLNAQTNGKFLFMAQFRIIQFKPNVEQLACLAVGGQAAVQN